MVPPHEQESDAQARLLSRFGRRISAGEVLFSDGDTSTDAFLLQEGRVRLIKRVGAVERSLRVLRAGDLFGESALMQGAPRNATAVVLNDGVVLVLDHGTLEQVLAGNPAVGMRLLQQLIRRLRDAEDQIELLMLRDVRSKVVSALIKLAQGHQGSHSDGRIELVVSPIELASRVGVEVDAVRRTVQELRDAGHLQLSGERVEIPDLATLRELSSLLTVRDQIVGMNPIRPLGPPAIR